MFSDIGYSTHEIQRVGDGRYCNKVAQLTNLRACEFSWVALLDTDTIAVADLRPFFSHRALVATVVNLENPPLATLREIASLAGMRKLPPMIPVDNGPGKTYVGNCNGGLYVIPKSLCDRVDRQWRHWTNWLLAHKEPLQRAGKEAHIDQVAMWLTIQMGQIPYLVGPSNMNCHVHLAERHRRMDPRREIAMIHYHDFRLNPLGLIEAVVAFDGLEGRAIAKANAQIGSGFDNQTFWNLRYSLFPERGSGRGSRDQNVQYKRQLLASNGVEQATSVLDVGCGDLEVLKTFNLHGYLGLDVSESALQRARAARPDWQFQLLNIGKDHTQLPAKEMVLCFEVLIHQNTRAAYDRAVDFLARQVRRTLIVSGYDRDQGYGKSNSMVFFYEPLEDSLRRTGRFSSIRKIGEHTDVSVYRCDV